MNHDFFLTTMLLSDTISTTYLLLHLPLKAIASPMPTPLTPELHVGNDDLLTDAGQRILVLKQMLVVWPFTHRGKELDSIAY